MQQIYGKKDINLIFQLKFIMLGKVISMQKHNIDVNLLTNYLSCV